MRFMDLKGGGHEKDQQLGQVGCIAGVGLYIGAASGDTGRASADPAQFDIAPQPLPDALKNFAAQAKMQLLYRYDIVSHAPPTRGRATREARRPGADVARDRPGGDL